MADDGLEWFEAAMGAVSRINLESDTTLEGARCPKCDARDFVKISDLYSESIGRLEAPAEGADEVLAGGMTPRQVVQRFVPPRRTSALGVGGAVAVILAIATYLVYRRFGETPGELSILVSIVITTIVLLSTLRRFSDRFYHKRQRWNRLHMCRQCGQLVSA